MIKLEYMGITVDLTGNNTAVTCSVNNPVYVLPTPVFNQVYGASPTPNEFVIDISMISTTFVLSFDLLDGVSGQTFLDLFYIIRDGATNPTVLATFTWNSFETTVKMTSLRMGTEPGKKDFMPGCSMTLQMAKELYKV